MAIAYNDSDHRYIRYTEYSEDDFVPEYGLEKLVGKKDSQIYDFKMEKSKKDRKYILDKVNNDDKQISRSACNSMIRHLIRYGENNLHLSREGYKEINNNWKKIQSNNDYDDNTKRKVEYYLLKEYGRFKNEDDKIEKKSSWKDNIRKGIQYIVSKAAVW